MHCYILTTHNEKKKPFYLLTLYFPTMSATSPSISLSLDLIYTIFCILATSIIQLTVRLCLHHLRLQTVPLQHFLE